jgi:hypothetical protein
MGDRFQDSLDAATYVDDDETVGVWELNAEDSDALWLSGRLFRRLTTVAAAYHLHTLPTLGGSESVALDKIRCGSLLVSRAGDSLY